MNVAFDSPLVSFIVPAYNAERFLGQTLQSIREQSYTHFEVWVIDDGSLDQTPHIVRAIAQQDPRFHLLQQDNAGVAIARNLGIHHAKGDLIAPIDADDVWHPDTLKHLVSTLQSADMETALAYTWSVDIDEHNHSLNVIHAATIQGYVLKTLVCHNFIGNASSTLIRRQCLMHVGGYNSNLREQNAQGCEDWDLYLKLAKDFKFAVVPMVLVGYRKVSQSMSRDFGQMSRSQLLILEQARQANPALSPLLFHISCSSLYLYFAHQCHSISNPNETLYWLKQALKVDYITPLIRPGFYYLGLKSWLQLQISPFPVQTNIRREPSASYESISVSHLNMVSTWFPPSFSRLQRLRIFLKVCVGNLLHFSLAAL